MDIFSHTVNLKSRSDVLKIWWLCDLHEGAPNHDSERLDKTIRDIKVYKGPKMVFLGGDLVDAIVLRDMKRFTPDNLNDDVLNGTPKQIRRRISNLGVYQADKVIKRLEPIREFLVGSVSGNHESAVMKSSGVDLHQIICDALGVRNCGDIGMCCIVLDRQTQSRVVRVAFMHTASGGRTAGASNNSLARAQNLFDADIVFQGHNHSPAIQRITSMGCTNPGSKNGPKLVRRDRIGVNNGAFLRSYMEGVNSYDQTALYNPKDEITYRVCIKLYEQHSSAKVFESPRVLISAEEIHV